MVSLTGVDLFWPALQNVPFMLMGLLKSAPTQLPDVEVTGIVPNQPEASQADWLR